MAAPVKLPWSERTTLASLPDESFETPRVSVSFKDKFKSLFFRYVQPGISKLTLRHNSSLSRLLGARARALLNKLDVSTAWSATVAFTSQSATGSRSFFLEIQRRRIVRYSRRMPVLYCLLVWEYRESFSQKLSRRRLKRTMAICCSVT